MRLQAVWERRWDEGGCDGIRFLETHQGEGEDIHRGHVRLLTPSPVY